MDLAEFHAFHDMLQTLHVAFQQQNRSEGINLASPNPLDTGPPPLPFPFPENLFPCQDGPPPPRFTAEDEELLATHIRRAEGTHGDLYQVMEHVSGVSRILSSRFLG